MAFFRAAYACFSWPSLALANMISFGGTLFAGRYFCMVAMLV